MILYINGQNFQGFKRLSNTFSALDKCLATEGGRYESIWEGCHNVLMQWELPCIACATPAVQQWKS